EDYEPGKGELIHDFKSLDQLTGARSILLNQDKQPQFRKLVNKYINKDGGQIEQFQKGSIFCVSQSDIEKLIDFLAQRDVEKLDKESLKVEQVDLLLILGNSRVEVVDEAYKVYKQKLVGKILIAGGVGRETEYLIQNLVKLGYRKENLEGKSEAEIFKERLLEFGVNEEDILPLDTESTNTEENIRNAIKILEEEQFYPQTILLFQHPLIQRRAVATFLKIIQESGYNRWQNIRLISFAPYIPEVSKMNEEEFLYHLNIALGEVYRLHPKVYGPEGKKYIIRVKIPEDIKRIYEEIRIKLYGILQEKFKTKLEPLGDGGQTENSTGIYYEKKYGARLLGSTICAAKTNTLTVEALDKVISYSEELKDFKRIYLGKLIIKEKDNYKFESPQILSQLPNPYQEKLKQIIGFISHRMTSLSGQISGLKINIVIEPVQIGKSSVWYDDTNTLHIQAIFLTDLVCDTYREFCLEHELFHINNPGLDEEGALKHCLDFLESNPQIAMKVIEFIDQTPYIELTFNVLLKVSWITKMSRGLSLGIKVNMTELGEIERSRKIINGIEYFDSQKHETLPVQEDWHIEGKVNYPFDESAFNFTKLYENIRPEHIVTEVELNGKSWYIGMNNMPSFKYHMLVVPREARQQLVTIQDILDMQELLRKINDSKATLLHNSLLGGAGVNSLHFHLHFYDFPIFKDGFSIYSGTEQYETKVFKGKNCVQMAGEYLKELQSANQPYNIIMRLNKIIIIPRPNDLEFPFGAQELAGSVFYGKDRTLDEAKQIQLNFLFNKFDRRLFKYSGITMLFVLSMIICYLMFTNDFSFAIILKYLGWIGIIFALSFSILGMVKQPVIMKEFLPIVAEGWAIFSILLAVSKYLRDMYVIQLLVLLGVIVGLSFLVHRGNVITEFPDFFDSVKVRFISVFAGALTSGFIFDISKSFYEQIFTALRWAIALGIISGYFTYFIYIPFIGNSFRKERFKEVSPIIKAGFDLTIGSLVIILPLQVGFGAAFGEGKDIVTEFQKTISSIITTYPYNFLFWFPINMIIWRCFPDSKKFKNWHAVAYALWAGILSGIVKMTFIGVSYPATMLSSRGKTRWPSKTERSRIIRALGGRKKLFTKGIDPDMLEIKIKPFLQTPAEVKGGILYVNPNILKEPLEQLKVIFEGHEYYHLKYPFLPEFVIRILTVIYLVRRKLLESHIRFLEVDNEIGLRGKKGWIRLLKIVYFFVNFKHSLTVRILKERFFEREKEYRFSLTNLNRNIKQILIYPATLPKTGRSDRVPTKEELEKIEVGFGEEGLKALAERSIKLLPSNVIFTDRLLPDGTLLPIDFNDKPDLNRASLTKERKIAGVIEGKLYLHHNFLQIPAEQRRIILQGHELWHLLGYDEEEAQKKTIEYLTQNNLLKFHLQFLLTNHIGLEPNRGWLERLIDVYKMKFIGKQDKELLKVEAEGVSRAEFKEKAKLYVLEFNEEKVDNINLVGGKGRSLAELTKIEGINVPEGFIITTFAYDRFIEANRLMFFIKELENLSDKWIKLELKGAERSEKEVIESKIRSKGQNIRVLMEKGTIPQEIIEVIKEKYEKLCRDLGAENISVAVRSSATAEDLPIASFVGQQDTFLNQRGVSSIIETVKKCWVSLYGDRSIIYRNQQRLTIIKREIEKGKDITKALSENSIFKHSQVKLAVVIQRIINAYAAGVGFNVNVATGKEGIQIEMNYGLGESVVSGKVNPDVWLLDPEAEKIEKKILGEKTQKVVCAEKGIRWIDTSNKERCNFVITDEKVKEIARQIKEISRYYKEKYGYEYMDTEFVIDKSGNLYFVQARPETIWSNKQKEAKLKIRGIPIKEAKKAKVIFEGGITGFLGVASGILRVVDNLDDAITRVREGDILVAVMTHPEWDIVIRKVRGVIVDIGGTTSHTAIVSRELGIPSILAAGDATETLKKFDGYLVTLDAINRLIYEGRLPVVEGDLEEFIREDVKRKKRVFRDHLIHKEDKEGQWIGKPEYPLAGWQLELYIRAWRLVEQRFNIKLRMKIENNTIYVNLEDLNKLGKIMVNLGIEELEKLFKERQETVNRFVECVDNFEISEEKIAEFFEIYTKLIMHFHIRWTFGARVMEPLQNQQLAQIPKKLRTQVLSYFNPPMMTETKKMEEEFEDLLKECRRCYSCFERDTTEQIIEDLRVQNPSLFKRIVAYARNYKHKGCKDDIRLPIPLSVVIETLKQGLKVQKEEKRKTFLRISKQEPPDVSKYVKDYDLFSRILRLAYLQAIQKENEHHLQVRKQWVLREKLLKFANELVDRKLLQNEMDIFEKSTEELISLVRVKKYVKDGGYFTSENDKNKPLQSLLYKKIEELEEKLKELEEKYKKTQAEQDKKKLIDAYEKILKDRYILCPQIEFKEEEAFDPLNPQHIRNAYDIVKELDELTKEIDRVSENYRLEIAKKLKELVTPSKELEGFIDLHVHTFRSDGQYSPTYVVYEAWKKGLKAIGVVDHNTFRHFREAVEAGEIFGIKVIPGVEFDVSGKFSVKREEKTLEYMHLIVYFPYGSGIRQRENKEEFLKWLDKLEQDENSLYHQAEKRRLWNNIKQELIRQRFNISQNRGNFEITISDWVNYTTDIPNWAQIVAILIRKYKDTPFSSISEEKKREILLNKLKKDKEWKNRSVEEIEQEVEKRVQNPSDEDIIEVLRNYYVNRNKVDSVLTYQFIQNEKGEIDLRVRGPVDFWKHKELNNKFDDKYAQILGNEFPHPFGIDIGILTTEVKKLNGLVVLPHPIEKRNYWTEEQKIYEKASSLEKAVKLKEVINSILKEIPLFKDVFWGIEVFSAKHSEDEIEEFGELVDILKKELKKVSFFKTIGSDTHYNDYEGEGMLQIGSGKEGNLNEYQENRYQKELLELLKDGGGVDKNRIVKRNKHSASVEDVEVSEQLINEFVNKNRDERQVEQFQLDTVVSSPAYLQGFNTKKLGKVIIRGKNDFEIEKLEDLDYAYQDRLKQIIGFVSHYINGPPLEVDLTIVPCQVNKPSIWYEPSLNTIYLQVILLTEEIPIEYVYFVAYYNFVLIRYKGLNKKEVLEEIKLYLQQFPDMRYKLYDFWLKDFTPIKIEEVSLLPPEAKERLNEKYDKLVKEFYDKEIEVNAIYNNPDYYDLSKKDKNGLPVPFREEAAGILTVPFLEYKGGRRLLSNIKDIREKINKIFEKFNLNAEDYIVWVSDNLLHTSIFTVKKSYKENLS
ncbi:MAG: hypothetical protein DRP72_00465, partial [Candidatus Omnitrophota bacterium]